MRGDGPGRPLEFGQAIGQLTRELIGLPLEAARRQLTSAHGLDARAAQNLLAYLHDQVAATGYPPSDRTIVVESFLDEVGDWRVVLMTPFGSRVHAPWATAVQARLRSEHAGDVDMVVSDDGIVFRLPESDQPPDVDLFFPNAEDVEEIVVHELGGTAMFAARFRENAARRSCFRADNRASARHSGCSVANRRICSPWPRAMNDFRSCSKRTASASAMRSIFAA